MEKGVECNGVSVKGNYVTYQPSLNASDYICEVYGYSYDHTSLTIVMEYMAQGDLFSILHTVFLPSSGFTLTP